jgi:hypothetical protein
MHTRAPNNTNNQVLATEALGPHATKYTVDVKLNGHWTDTVHEAPPASSSSSSNGRHNRGGRGRGRGDWGRRGGGDRKYEPDPKRSRHG